MYGLPAMLNDRNKCILRCLFFIYFILMIPFIIILAIALVLYDSITMIPFVIYDFIYHIYQLI